MEYLLFDRRLKYKYIVVYNMKKKNMWFCFWFFIFIFGGTYLAWYMLRQQEYFGGYKGGSQRYFAQHQEEIQKEIDNRPEEVPDTDYSIVKGDWLTNPTTGCDPWGDLSNNILYYTCFKKHKMRSGVEPKFSNVEGEIDLKKCKTMIL